MILFSVYISRRVFLSYKQQIKIQNNISSGDYGNSKDFEKNLEYKIPNLSLTAIPLKALKALYIQRNADIEKDKNWYNESMDLLYESIQDNPYIMFSEGSLAEIYYTLKIKDSAYKYARKSFEGLPKNSIHYAMLSKLYANEGKIDSIIFQYHERNTPPKQGINTIYLASMNNFFNQLPDSLSKIVLNDAKSAKKRFKKSKDVQELADRIIYGNEKVEQALNYEDKGEELLANKQTSLGIDNYLKSLEIRENNINLIQILGLAYFNIQDYYNVIFYMDKLENMNIALDPLSLYVKGISLLQVNRKTEACDYLLRSKNFGREDAKKYYEGYCDLD